MSSKQRKPKGSATSKKTLDKMEKDHARNTRIIQAHKERTERKERQLASAGAIISNVADLSPKNLSFLNNNYQIVGNAGNDAVQNFPFDDDVSRETDVSLTASGANSDLEQITANQFQFPQSDFSNNSLADYSVAGHTEDGLFSNSIHIQLSSTTVSHQSSSETTTAGPSYSARRPVGDFNDRMGAFVNEHSGTTAAGPSEESSSTALVQSNLSMAEVNIEGPFVDPPASVDALTQSPEQEYQPAKIRDDPKIKQSSRVKSKKEIQKEYEKVAKSLNLRPDRTSQMIAELNPDYGRPLDFMVDVYPSDDDEETSMKELPSVETTSQQVPPAVPNVSQAATKAEKRKVRQEAAELKKRQKAEETNKRAKAKMEKFRAALATSTSIAKAKLVDNKKRKSLDVEGTTDTVIRRRSKRKKPGDCGDKEDDGDGGVLEITDRNTIPAWIRKPKRAEMQHPTSSAAAENVADVPVSLPHSGFQHAGISDDDSTSGKKSSVQTSSLTETSNKRKLRSQAAPRPQKKVQTDMPVFGNYETGNDYDVAEETEVLGILSQRIGQQPGIGDDIGSVGVSPTCNDPTSVYPQTGIQLRKRVSSAASKPPQVNKAAQRQVRKVGEGTLKKAVVDSDYSNEDSTDSDYSNEDSVHHSADSDAEIHGKRQKIFRKARQSTLKRRKTKLKECNNWIEDQLGDRLQTGCNSEEQPADLTAFDPSTRSILTVFRDCFSHSFWERVAYETNSHFAQNFLRAKFDEQLKVWNEGGKKMSKPTKPTTEDFAKELSKEDVTHLELEVFVGILLYMVIYKLPDYRFYWDGRTPVNIISSRMSQARFDHIRKYLRFAYAEDVVPQALNENPLVEATMLITRFQSYCKTLPRSQYVWIEDVVVSSDGNVCDAKKYYRTHHGDTTGLRIFSLRSPTGLIQGFRCYRGRKAADATENKMKAMIVIKELLSELPPSPHQTLWLSEEFASIKLFEWLKKHGYRALGALEKDLIEPDAFQLLQSVQRTRLQKEEGYVRGITNRDGTLHIRLWSYDKSRMLLCTNHNANPMAEAVDSQDGVSDPETTDIFPTLHNLKRMHRYHLSQKRHMVTLSRHNIDTPTERWYVTLFHWIVGAAMCNSSNLVNSANRDHRNDVPLIDHILELAQELLLVKKVPVTEKNVTGRESVKPGCAATVVKPIGELESDNQKAVYPVKTSDSLRLDGIDHWPIYTTDKTEYTVKDLETDENVVKVKFNQRRCAYANCPKKTKSGRTVVKCEKCNQFLCFYRDRNCFTNYHQAEVGNKSRAKRSVKPQVNITGTTGANTTDGSRDEDHKQSKRAGKAKMNLLGISSDTTTDRTVIANNRSTLERIQPKLQTNVNICPSVESGQSPGPSHVNSHVDYEAVSDGIDESASDSD